MYRNILSLDQARKTGYSIYRNGKIIGGGVWDLNKIKGRCEQLLFYHDRLMKTIKRERITEIVAEDMYNDKHKNTLICLGEIRGVMLLAAVQNNIPVTFINPLDHKYFTTGNKYANKAETMSVLDDLGYRYKDDNEADTISIMLCYLNDKKLPVIHSNEIRLF